MIRPRAWKRISMVLHASIVALAFCQPPPANAGRIEDVHFSDEISIEDDAVPILHLHGLGLLRYRILFRGYVAALYLPDGVSGDRALDDLPRRLELSYFWAIKGKDFAHAADALLARSLDPEQVSGLRERLDTFHLAYRDVEPSDRYSLTYRPGVGTELRLNDEPLVTVPGNDFARAYFGIWLGDHPLDEELRNDLLRRR